MQWITDWNEIDSETDYIVCPINQRPDGSTYLGGRGERMKGWLVVRYTPKCYAALPLPDWTEADHQSIRSPPE